MAQQTFEQFIDTERARLTTLKDEITKKMSDLQEQLAGIEREIRAIEAYETVKAGKQPATDTRAPRGSKSSVVLRIVGNNPGLTRGEIIERMGIKGNKSQEGSLSNLLATLKKKGQLTTEGGKYSTK